MFLQDVYGAYVQKHCLSAAFVLSTKDVVLRPRVVDAGVDSLSQKRM